MANLFNDDLVYDDGDEHVDGLSIPAVPVAQQNFNTQQSEPLTPQTNNKLIGHDEVEARLTRMVAENCLPHALIFTGPDGVGKATMAVRLARTLLTRVDAPVDNSVDMFGVAAPPPPLLQNLSADMTHPDSVRLMAGSHPDFMLLSLDTIPENKSGIIPVEEARRVPQFLSLKSGRTDGWRVVLVDGAHRLNNAAQNALLKIIEEPPTRTVLILVTSQMGRILPTIRSRAHLVTFSALNPTDFAAAIQYLGIYLPAADLKWMRTLSDGCPGQITAIEEREGLTLIRDFLALFAAWPSFDENAWYRFTENLAAANEKDTYRFLFHFWNWWVRELCAAKVDPGRRDSLVDVAGTTACDPFIHRFSLAELLEICDKLQDHTARTEQASLEPRQAMYSARQLMEKS